MLNGAVVFRSGVTPLPEDHWNFEMDSWEDCDFLGGSCAYREERVSENEDPGLLLSVISGEYSVEEIPPNGQGTSLLGRPEAAYLFGAITVIEYPATTIGLNFSGDPSGWTFELRGYDFSGGLEMFGVLDTRTLSSPGAVEWSVENGFNLSLVIFNDGLESIDSLVIDSLYVGDFVGDPIPECSPVMLAVLGFGIAVGRRCRKPI